MSNPYDEVKVDPYQSPMPTEQPQKPIDKSQPIPGWLIAVAVISIILGFLGVFTHGFALFQLFFFNTMPEGAPANAQEELIVAQAPYRLIQIALNSVSMIGDLVLIVCGMGSFFPRKTWAYHGLKIMMFVFAILTVVGSVIGVVVMTASMDALQKQFEEAGQAGMDMRPILIAGLVIGLIFNFLFLLFYLISGIYLQRSRKTREFLGVDSAAPFGADV